MNFSRKKISRYITGLLLLLLSSGHQTTNIHAHTLIIWEISLFFTDLNGHDDQSSTNTHTHKQQQKCPILSKNFFFVDNFIDDDKFRSGTIWISQYGDDD